MGCWSIECECETPRVQFADGPVAAAMRSNISDVVAKLFGKRFPLLPFGRSGKKYSRGLGCAGSHFRWDSRRGQWNWRVGRLQAAARPDLDWFSCSDVECLCDVCAARLSGGRCKRAMVIKRVYVADCVASTGGIETLEVAAPMWLFVIITGLLPAIWMRLICGHEPWAEVMRQAWRAICRMLYGLIIIGCTLVCVVANLMWVRSYSVLDSIVGPEDGNIEYRIEFFKGELAVARVISRPERKSRSRSRLEMLLVGQAGIRELANPEVFIVHTLSLRRFCI